VIGYEDAYVTADSEEVSSVVISSSVVSMVTEWYSNIDS
jgi:hypothetical protein